MGASLSRFAGRLLLPSVALSNLALGSGGAAMQMLKRVSPQSCNACLFLLPSRLGFFPPTMSWILTL